MSLPSDGRGDAAPLASRAREPAADPADDGITTVTVTLLEDPRGGAARVSRKRDDAPLVGDDDDASPRDGASDFESRVRRAPADALQEGDDVWNAVLTAFEAHCLQGGDAAKNGDETEVAAFDADAAANSAFPGAAPEETSPSLRQSESAETFLPPLPSTDADDGGFAFGTLGRLDEESPAFAASGIGFGGAAHRDGVATATDATNASAPTPTLFFSFSRSFASSDAFDAQPFFFDAQPFDAQPFDAQPFDAEPFDASKFSASEGGAHSASAAELVRAHAARALRSLIFGRDDGRGRRRCAVEGPRVSRRRGKKKEAAADDDAADADADADAAAEDRDRDRDRDRDPDDASLGAHYARRDPARWRAAATTASSVAALKASAEAALKAPAASDPLAAPDFLVTEKIAALRADFAVELERLAVVERGLVAGEHGALARWPRKRSERERERDAASFAVHSVAPEATRAMRDSAAAKFRECRFRILETFERDVVRVARRDGGNASFFFTNDDVERPSFLSSRSSGEARNRNLATSFSQTHHAGETSGAGSKRRRRDTRLWHQTPSPPLDEYARLPTPRDFPIRASEHGSTDLPPPREREKQKESSSSRGKSRHSTRARAVLETWLAEHFYPTETRAKPVPTREEKKALALETGLTERQVGDWFVNARARVWKPEMRALLMGETMHSQSR